jgi:hypothetical protein
LPPLLEEDDNISLLEMRNSAKLILNEEEQEYVIAAKEFR